MMLYSSLTNDELIRCLEESDSELCQEAAKRLASAPDINALLQIHTDLKSVRQLLTMSDSDLEQVTCSIEKAIGEKKK